MNTPAPTHWTQGRRYCVPCRRRLQFMAHADVPPEDFRCPVCNGPTEPAHVEEPEA